MTNQRYPIWMVGYPGALLLDITGPLQVFAMANRFLPAPRYTTGIVSLDGEAVQTDAGVTLQSDDALATVPAGGDLVVPGGPGMDSQLNNPAFIAALRAAARNRRRLVSVCSGSLLLAEAGLLDGREATGHWRRTPQMTRDYPKVRWTPDAIYVRDGHIYSSAGVTAGIDLALALVEADLGSALALQVAQELVVYLRRPGGQSQFSRPLEAQHTAPPAVRRVYDAVLSAPEKDWRVSDLADLAGMTERSLHRHFVKAFGQGPARFVESIRLAAARSALEQSGRSVSEIARLCGFRDAQTLRRAFRKHLGVSPGDYRERFFRAAPG
ncbi:MAG: GlxA family transcriptional regulator [Kiloniellales bacterium]|nr:GlxA family transcriptional regulator [Kiloniellales bacterium]